MSSLLLVCDHMDASLGSYFAKSRDFLLSSLPPGINPTIVAGCTSAVLEKHVQMQQGGPFILTAYAHGTEDALYVAENRVLYEQPERSGFSRAFVYSTACSTGSRLGPNLIATGCRCFIGYTKIVDKIIKSEEHIADMVRCENYALILFLSVSTDAYSAYLKMLGFFDTLISKYQALNDILSAAIILEVKESCVFLGERGLTREQL